MNVEGQTIQDPVYVGRWTGRGRTVWVDQDGARRPLAQEADQHASGFEWGQAGPGALELSRSILRDATQAEPLAEKLGRDFTWDVVPVSRPTASVSRVRRCWPGWNSGLSDALAGDIAPRGRRPPAKITIVSTPEGGDDRHESVY